MQVTHWSLGFPSWSIGWYQRMARSWTSTHVQLLHSESKANQLQSYKFIERKFWCFTTRCLGVFSPQGRHNTTYIEHMPMKELHIAMQPACAGKFWYRSPWQVQGAALPFASRLLWKLVPTLWGLKPEILYWYTSTHKDYAMTISNKWTQHMPRDLTYRLGGLMATLICLVIAS